MIDLKNLPPQMLPYSKKTKEWRKQHCDWADRRTYYFGNMVRNSLLKKRVNYNLINGILDMRDVELILNPDSVNALYVPESIQHFPIMNSKLHVLQGEEAKRRFEFKVIVTNPSSISEIENSKLSMLQEQVQSMIEDENLSEEEFDKELDKLSYYFDYQWQDMIEMRASTVLNHYMKELNIPKVFNDGFMDAMICGEEIYQCDIVGGEPTFERLNPLKVHIFKNGFSNKVEDADLIILIDFWSPGRILDTYFDVLTKKDVDSIDRLASTFSSDSMYNIDERNAFINTAEIDGTDISGGTVVENFLLMGQSGFSATSNYYDLQGNIRVLRLYWKSKRKIKKVKSYDPETGEEIFDFYPETYIIDKTLGEEEEVFWINEAWEGTKIGPDIYVNMRPRIVQYNRLSNPSRCHFGIVGSMYNLNDSRPFSLVDMMKPYAYFYDIIYDRLNKAIAANWGKILKLDLAMVPKGWEIDKWLYYAKINHVAVTDSFKEGNGGAAQGKIAGALNNQSNGVIDAEQGNYIQEHINLLEFIKNEMGEVAGITRQREGQISNRETVGGVERSNLQSSHITEWLFTMHDDVKKRALECFLETTKIAMRGRNKKFQYITSDGAIKSLEIDGDTFADSDYGIVVDASPETQNLASKLDALAQAALQNQTLSFSSIMKIYTSSSLSEIRRTIEKDEQAIQERQAEQAQQEQEMAQQQIQAQMEMKQAEMEFEDMLNQRDNDTKILIEHIKQSGNAENEVPEVQDNSMERAKLDEQIRQFNERLAFDKSKLSQEMALKEKDLAIKRAKPKSSNVSK
ncbi:portal protein [uncultured phage cr108_1]|uniref:Portal protein n=1 Tax=uncultured phage cr108_1 TaxID=2772069 RepID=A0A7M1RZH3_9CAUD|nr:portal protein [uncultured phage cr108_1]QOR58959.1 portal protein [uncultured phage cr108_1]DAU77618.1 MAG TPA: portal protein [Crassvirales sp.]